MSKKRTPKHGTYSEYNHHKCRCDACRAAWRAYQREWSRTKDTRSQREPPVHGASGYTNYHCRCQVCRDGHYEENKRYYGKYTRRG